MEDLGYDISSMLQELEEKDDEILELKELLRELYSIIKVETSSFFKEEHKNILKEVERILGRNNIGE